MAIDYLEEGKLKKTTFGSGLVKGLGITLRHLLSRSVTVHYPDEMSPLPPRSRGVIALKEENCTVCMLCARECPCWCIYIDGHKEERKPKEPGRRAKKYNVLDRFAIDYALCMYCGICVEVCPYDALFWSPEFEYAEHDITKLTHEMDKLADWMYSVLPPPPLEEGAKGPELKAAAPRPAAPTQPEARAAAPQEQPDEPAQEAAPAEVKSADEPEAPPTVETPEPAEAAAGGVSAEEAAEVRTRVYQEEIAKGVDPRVAEGRAKAAELRARKGTKGPGGT